MDELIDYDVELDCLNSITLDRIQEIHGLMLDRLKVVDTFGFIVYVKYYIEHKTITLITKELKSYPSKVTTRLKELQRAMRTNNSKDYNSIGTGIGYKRVQLIDKDIFSKYLIMYNDIMVN